MSSTKRIKVQKYSRIVKYLEDYHKDLLDVIDYSGMFNSLTPRKNGGLTLLIPTGEQLKELIKEAEGEHPEEAVKILKSLILRVALPGVSDWDKMRDDIPNLLGYKLDIKTISDTQIRLKNGAVIKPDTQFVPVDNRKNMAIWIVSSGSIPLDGTPSELKYVHSTNKKKKNNAVEVDVDNARSRYAKSVERAYVRNRNVYLQEVSSLLYYLKNRRRDLFELSQAMLDTSAKISFYILLEPYGVRGHIIPRDVLDKWGLKLHGFPNAETFWRKVFNSLDSRESDALIYSKKGRAKLRETMKDVRENLTLLANPTAKTKKTHELYLELESKNTISGVGPVFSPHVYQLYKERSGYKEWQDNVRFLARKYFDTDDMNEVHEKMTELSGEDYGRESIVTSTEFIKRGTTTGIITGLIEGFIYTNLLLYTPCIVDEWSSVKNKEEEEDSESSEDFVNFAAEELDYLSSAKTDKGFSQEYLEDQLRLYRKTDPDGFKQLQKKFQEYKSAASSAENSEAGEDIEKSME